MTDSHPELFLGTGDTIIFSSSVIPGNEQSISFVQRKLRQKGVDVIVNSTENWTHVTGHPRQV